GGRELAGKDVVFAPTAPSFQDAHFLPGHNRVPGAFIHVIGAETLKRGNPTDIGWMPAFALALLTTLGAVAFRRGRWFNATALGTIAALIVVKVWLTTMLVTCSIGAALVLIGVFGANVSRRRRRESALHENP